jgi:hypothetical protein
MTPMTNPMMTMTTMAGRKLFCSLDTPRLCVVLLLLVVINPVFSGEYLLVASTNVGNCSFVVFLSSYKKLNNKLGVDRHLPNPSEYSLNIQMPSVENFELYKIALTACDSFGNIPKLYN